MIKALVLGLIFGSAAPLFAQPAESLSARQILDKMVSVYSSCTSYSDKGKLTEVKLDGRLRVTPFKTAFVRPSHFRFEFQEVLRANDYVIWQDGAKVKSWWLLTGKARSYETIDEALSAAVGVTRSSSIQVPSMLFGDLHDSRWIQNLSQLVLMREEKVEGRLAYKIKGNDRTNRELTLWIDKKKFFLLKTFDFVAATITYQPEINGQIPPDKLAFKH